jgi:ribose/xylose/arabinose/galactoside ABC-type transport system permease subunit
MTTMKKTKIKFTFNLALLIIWIVIFAGISIITPAFLSPDYIISVLLKNIIEIGMVALPMTLVIITGGIDLSVGNIMVLCCVLGSMAYTAGGDLLAVSVTIIIGILCGLFNGFMIAKARISAMVATLATMYLYLGLARGISMGLPKKCVYSYDFANFMGNTVVAGLPLQIWLYVLLAVLFAVLLGMTSFGRKLYAIGMNANACQYAGIDTEKILIILYTLCGLICALASFIWMGRFTSVKYDAGTNFNLKVITIVVLGGTSIAGGSGDMRGTIIGTLIVATLNSGLTVLNIPIDVQTVVEGTVLIIALIANALVTSRSQKKRILKVEATGAGHPAQ